MKFKEVNTNVAKAVADNNGYCPCAVEQTEDTKCPCKMFREETEVGELCICGRFERLADDDATPKFDDFTRIVYEVEE